MRLPSTPVQSDRMVVFADTDGSLPGAAAEAEELVRANGAVAFVGREVTGDRLRATGEVGLLHLAMHAGVGDRGAWLRLHDGRFFVGDILGCGIRADVVVLASCSSGVSRSNEHTGSLAASFLANGSGAVIAALSSIEDDATRELVRGLYRHDVAERPIEALAEV